MSSSISSFFSSFLPVVHADSEDKPEKEAEAKQEEEEEEEPEDVYPAIQEEAKQSAKCAQLTKHFEHCQEKVQSGQGFKGEDCVEELMMHCVEEIAAPKLFSKLR
ncbi:hypothetical protein D9615_007817 [Tricholomella constricta]|uniref:Ubiquinol-cytochrome C reductase hinge domain-containing protein n=1 Tax=Tricholomella constricta TaxID=117010 RepID=A0A8H5M100_9AGAR|nr:hypothetical protein D9615_007817 [Tricholomella constricta]